MDMAAYALKQAGIRVCQLFATEIDPRIREHLARNHAIEVIYNSVQCRPVDPYRTDMQSDQTRQGVDL